jgi:hypothetical protein
MSVDVMMMLRVLMLLVVLTVVCVAMCCRRMGTQRFCWRAGTVTSMWRGGLCRMPAAMRDRSETMSVVAVGGLRDTVLSGSDCTVSSDDFGLLCAVVL